MVDQLLSLITPPSNPPPSTPAQRVDSQQSSIRSSVRRIGQLITPSFHNIRAQSEQSPLLFSTPRIISHQVDSSAASTGDSASSPVRTRRRSALANINTASGSSFTPRRGSKIKQRRGDATNDRNQELDGVLRQWNQRNYSGLGISGKPTTAYLGWRRLQIQEILSLQEGAFIIITIPPHSNFGYGYVLVADQMRNEFRNRVAQAVMRSKAHEFDKECGDSPLIQAFKWLNLNNSLKCNHQTYIEIACVVYSYPHREDYISQRLPTGDVRLHLDQGAGLELVVLDYPAHSRRGVGTIRLAWKEVPYIEVFTSFTRGDDRPVIALTQRNAEHLYAEEVSGILDQVKNDDRQTLELALALEKEKVRILKRQLRQAKSAPTNPSPPEDNITQFLISIEYEFKGSRLQQFAQEKNLAYKKAWNDHYTGFHSLDRLLPEALADDIYTEIQTKFPLHFYALRNIMFGFQAFIPSRSHLDLSSKKRALTNYFFAMIRVRDSNNLIYWAMVGTMAMFNNGALIQHFKNPLIGSFSAGKDCTFKYLHRLYDETAHIRRILLANQAYGGSSFDNYNCDHLVNAFLHGSAYHKGIVYNFVCQRAFPVPVGTTVMDRYTGIEWTIHSSTMVDTWTCMCTVKIFHPPLLVPHIRRGVNLPSVHWKIVAVPGDPMPSVEITYIDQHIPESMRQKVPRGHSMKQLIFGDRSWMKDHENQLQMRPFTPREHLSAMQSIHSLQQLFFYNRWSAGDEFVITDKHHNVVAAFVNLAFILNENEHLEKNVREYQVDSLRYWNVTYDDKDRVMMFPIIPRDEMKNDEAMLAMIDMMDELAILDKDEHGNHVLSPTAMHRKIFQYGDVLSIRKWYSLRFYILRKMTHIGREEYVSMILTAYDRFIMIHDYLHENIHRLQVIYKLYYGGFIQAVQALLKSKRIKMDPTKGAWKEHKAIVRKIYHALERLRIELYFEVKGPNIMGDFDNAEDALWHLQGQFKDYCDELEHAPCQITRMCALFMKITETWILCDDAISPGDWAVLEVFGCDWIDVWAVTGKYQYTLETNRRIEKLYQLPWHELEYHRDGRFVMPKTKRRRISYDHMCETQNMTEKKLPSNPNFEEVVYRSRHLHVGQRAQEEIFPNSYRQRKGNSMAPDINLIYTVFKKAGVFKTPNVTSEVNDNTFWKHVVADETASSHVNSKHKSLVSVPITPTERTTLEFIWDKTEINPCSVNDGHKLNDGDENVNDDEYVSASSLDENSRPEASTINPSVGVAKSVAFSSVCTYESFDDEVIENDIKDMGDMLGMLDAVDDNIVAAKKDIEDREIFEMSKEIVYGESTPARSTVGTPATKTAQTPSTPAPEKALKKLGNLTKYKLNRECLLDPFEKGRRKTKNIKSERKAELAILERKTRLIWLSVEFFKEKRANENASLRENLASKRSNEEAEYAEWEKAMDDALDEYDYEEYMNNA